MYTESVIRELEELKSQYTSLINNVKIKNAMEISSDIYGYYYVDKSIYLQDDPNGYYHNGTPSIYKDWHPGKNLVYKYGFHLLYPNDYNAALQATAKAIQEDVKNQNYDKLEYLDYLVLPTFTFNGKTIKNCVFDLVGFNHHARQGYSETPRGILFQIHSVISISDTYNNLFNTNLNTACATNVENTLGVTLKTINIYMGENLNNAWQNLKIFIPDEREICHPVHTYTENQDSTMWPMTIYQLCPQYRFKQYTYMLYNQVYNNADNISIIDNNGYISSGAKTTSYYIPFQFVL
jgi:hypothetical protein